MAAYQAWGVDLSIDLEHQMLSASPSSDPTARDARGWAKLELRDDGSLWAVDVRWTPDGAARLSEKRQRYVSPAFEIDKESKRITKIVNIAITSIPATHQTPALVAASSRGAMDPKLVQQALDALVSGDTKAAFEILQSMIASAAGAEQEPSEAPAPEGEAMAPEMEAAAAPAEAPVEGEDEEDDEEKKAAMAVQLAVRKLTGTDDDATALEALSAFKAAHAEIEKDRRELAEIRATLEASERKKLCVELVKLGAEFPATVWADDKATSLKPRWAEMKIETLREHVEEQRAARSGKRAPAPPKGGPAREEGKTIATRYGVVTLSARELRTCEEVKADLQKYAENKALKESAAAAR